MDNLIMKLIKETDRGFFIIYRFDYSSTAYQEILRLRLDVLMESEFGEIAEVSPMFDHIKKHLVTGKYLCILNNDYGSDWWTVSHEERDI